MSGRNLSKSRNPTSSLDPWRHWDPESGWRSHSCCIDAVRIPTLDCTWVSPLQYLTFLIIELWLVVTGSLLILCLAIGGWWLARVPAAAIITSYCYKCIVQHNVVENEKKNAWIFYERTKLLIAEDVNKYKGNSRKSNWKTIRQCNFGKGMSQSVAVAITKYHRLRDLINIYFSQFWRLGSSRSRCWQIQCLLSPIFWL